MCDHTSGSNYISLHTGPSKTNEPLIFARFGNYYLCKLYLLFLAAIWRLEPCTALSWDPASLPTFAHHLGNRVISQCGGNLKIGIINMFVFYCFYQRTYILRIVDFKIYFLSNSPSFITAYKCNISEKVRYYLFFCIISICVLSKL